MTNLKLVIFSMAVFLLAEAGFNACAWMYFGYNIPGFEVGPLDGWLHVGAPAIVGADILLIFAYQHYKKQEEKNEN